MIVASISYIIARLFNPHNMYWHDLIHEKNILPDQDYDMLNSIAISRVINKQFTALRRKTKIKDFFNLLSQTNANIFPVIDDKGMLEGVIWLDQIRKQLFDMSTNDIDTVAEIM